MEKRLTSFTHEVGASTFQVIEYLMSLMLTLYLSVRAAFVHHGASPWLVIKSIAKQTYQIGYQSFPIIATLGFATGSVVIIQALSQLSRFGSEGAVGQILVTIIFRELGPLITSLIIIARSAPAIAAELGNMRVAHETEALESIGINPMSFLVFPRIIAGVISAVSLSFYFSFIAMMGGYVTASFSNDISFMFYLSNISQAINSTDIILFLFKGVFCGVSIFIISCYQGLKVQNSFEEIPTATAKAVVHSIVLVVCLNLACTAIYYLNALSKMGVL